MADLVPLIGTLIFLGIGLVSCIITCICAKTDRKLYNLWVITAVICLWLMWFCVYSAQINPLMYPKRIIAGAELMEKIAALRALLGGMPMLSSLGGRLQVKSWLPLLKPGNYSLPPAHTGELFGRIQRNAGTYSANYALVFVVMTLYTLLTSPMLIVSIFLVLGLYVFLFHIRPDFEWRGQLLSNTQKYAVVVVAAAIMMLLSSALSSLLWIVSTSVLLCLIHAACFNYEAVEQAFIEPTETV